jgi:hypothetical protein
MRLQTYGRDLGIRADGRDPGVSFRSLEEASGNARILAEQGYGSVLVFDRYTGQTLRSFSATGLRH